MQLLFSSVAVVVVVDSVELRFFSFISVSLTDAVL